MRPTTSPSNRVPDGPGSLVEHQQTLYRSRNATRRWLHAARRDWIVGAIERHCPRGTSRALEVGPGSAPYLPLVASNADECFATDVEDEYLANARLLQRERSNLSVIRDDITATKLAGSTFDFILCSEVIEHLKDSRRALQNLSVLLRPGGVLVLSTPQRYSSVELVAKVALSRPLIGLARAVYREPVLELGHINLLSERDCERQIKAANLTIIERHKGGLYLPLIAEFMGSGGLALEKWLESRFVGSALSFVLWTQYYVATKGTQDAVNAVSSIPNRP